MHSKNFFIIAVSTFLSVLTATANPQNKRGIEPTAPGQVGVNPVTAEPASKYVSIVGPATDYYQSDGSTTIWIGVNTEYLTEEVVTTTVDNVPTSVTKSAPILFATATAAAEGIAIGDVAMIMDPKLTEALNSIAADVAATCAGKKRQACDSRIAFAQAAQAEIRPGGRLDFDFGDWIEVPTITAADVSAVLSAITGAPGVLGAFIFVYIVAIENKGSSPTPNIAPVNNIPATLTGSTTTNTPTTTSGCAPGAPTGSDAPVCIADDCKGPNDGPKDKDRRCSEGEWKDCPCIREVGAIAQQRDEGWLNDQQSVLQWIVDHDSDSATPWCIHGASPRSGKIPSSYCQCGENYASIYSVAESTTSPYNPCPYTEAPGPTITFQDPPQPTSTPTDTPAPQAKCNVNPCPDVEKTKRDYPWMHLGTATDSAKSFCRDNAGKDVGPSSTGPSPEHTYQDASDHKYFDGSPAEFLVKAYADPAKQLDENDCKTAVDIILNGCDTCTNDPKFGGRVTINGLEILINPMRFIPCISC